MTKIFVFSQNQEISKIEVIGHSLEAENGKNLTCAGVSAIVFGAINVVKSLFLKQINYNIDKSKTKIVFQKEKNLKLNKEELSKIKFFFDFLLVQLKTISYHYPNEIRIINKKRKQNKILCLNLKI